MVPKTKGFNTKITHIYIYIYVHIWKYIWNCEYEFLDDLRVPAFQDTSLELCFHIFRQIQVSKFGAQSAVNRFQLSAVTVGNLGGRREVIGNKRDPDWLVKCIKMKTHYIILAIFGGLWQAIVGKPFSGSHTGKLRKAGFKFHPNMDTSKCSAAISAVAGCFWLCCLLIWGFPQMGVPQMDGL